MLVKLELLRYRMVKKNYYDMLSRFHLIPDTGTSRTERRTDRRTELLYQYRASVCGRAIKTSLHRNRNSTDVNVLQDINTISHEKYVIFTLIKYKTLVNI